MNKSTTGTERKYIISKLEQYGLENASKRCKIFKVPYKIGEMNSIGIVGAYDRIHLHIPAPYFSPHNHTFKDAYKLTIKDKGLEHFDWYNKTLLDSNMNDGFQVERLKLMSSIPILFESAEEIDARFKQVAYNINEQLEPKLIQAGIIWGTGLTIVQQAAVIITKTNRTVSLFPTLGGIGALIYQGWQNQASLIENQCCDSKHAAVMYHQSLADIAYNISRYQHQPFLKRILISSSGNDWLYDIIHGRTTHRAKLVETNMIQAMIEEGLLDSTLQSGSGTIKNE